jgi:chitodextrinase
MSVSAIGQSVTSLANGTPLNGISVPKEKTKYFQLGVPAGARDLHFTTSGGTGDADLYVRRGALPSLTAYDAASIGPSNNESIGAAAPAAGTYFVMIRAKARVSNLTLRGAYTPPTPDSQAPTAPSGLSAVALSATTASIAWAPATDNVAVTSYRVFRGGAHIASVATTTYQDAGLAPNMSYTYTVTALDAAGNQSAPSAPASTTTPPLPADTQAPSVPMGLSATVVSATQINLSWGAASDDVGVTGYRVHRNGTLVGVAASTFFQDTGLTAKTTYTYTVVAFDSAGNVSAPSAPASATTSDTSPLAALAASMAPGTWAELGAQNLTSALLEVPSAVQTYNVLEFQDGGVWDPVTRQAMFIGGPHAGSGKFLVYSEDSNSWREEAPPPFSLEIHGYDHNAINPARREFYHRPYGTQRVWRYHIDNKTWSQLPSINGNYNCCGGLVHFPERDRLFAVGNDDASMFDYSTGQWSLVTSVIDTGPYHSTAEHSPAAQAVFFGGGSGVSSFFRMDASGAVTRLRNTPYPLDSGGHMILTHDPRSGRLLLFGENQTFYVYEHTTDTWQLQAQRPPFFDLPGARGAVNETIAIPLSTHGVVMILKYSWLQPKVYIYRHQ